MPVPTSGASERITHKTRWRKDWNLIWSHFYLKSKHAGHDVAVREARTKRWCFLRNALVGLLLLRPKTVVGQLARFFAAKRFLDGKPSWLRNEWVEPRPY
mgnify:FL=1